MRLNRRLLVAASLILGSACGGSTPVSPEPPSSTAPVTVPFVPVVVSPAVLVVAPASPQHNATIDYRTAPVTLTSTGLTVPEGAVVVDTFEYDTDPAFGSPTAIPATRQGTTSSIIVNVNAVNIDKDIYWRVRAASAEQMGSYSEVRRFKVPAEALRAPILIDPAAGSIQQARPDFTVSKLLHATGDGTWAYEFDIARDSGFASMAESSRVNERTGVMRFTPSSPLAPGRYYWRARAFDGSGTASGYSETRAFDVANPFAATPTPVSPAAGATVNQYAVITVRNGAIFGNSFEIPRYEAQIAATPAFSTVLAAGMEWASTSGTTTITITQFVPGGAYYWRTRSVQQRTSAHDEIASPWSEPRLVNLIGVTLGKPILLAPAAAATAPLRPTFIVNNVDRTGSPSVRYEFEISTHAQFATAPTATGSAAESGGQTSWTPTVNLPNGVLLWWRARAVDPATGTTSVYSEIQPFSTVPSNVNLYSLVLTVPQSCGFRTINPTIFVQSTDRLTASSIRLVAEDALPYTFDSLVLDLRVNQSAVTGTLEGSGSNYTIDGGSGVTTVTVTGTAGSSLSGTFSGRVREVFAPTVKTCTSSAFSWSILPR